MRIVQNSYSSLLAKFTLASDELSKKTSFFQKYKVDITLPSHSKTDSMYSTFDIIK